MVSGRRFLHFPYTSPLSCLLVPLVAWRRKANNRKWSHIIIRHRCDMGREGRKAEQSCCIPAKALGNLRLVTIDSRKCRRCCILRWRERREGGGPGPGEVDQTASSSCVCTCTLAPSLRKIAVMASVDFNFVHHVNEWWSE